MNKEQVERLRELLLSQIVVTKGFDETGYTKGKLFAFRLCLDMLETEMKINDLEYQAYLKGPLDPRD